jgi:hypothetical protein
METEHAEMIFRGKYANGHTVERHELRTRKEFLPVVVIE